MSLRILHTNKISTHLLTEGGKTTPDHTVGGLATSEDGKLYRYVKNSDDSAIDTYDACSYVNEDNFEVTQDISEGSVSKPAGVYDQSTQIAVNEYFWLQVAGYADINSETSSTIAAGEALVLHATADGECTDAARGSTDTDAVDAAEQAKIFAVTATTETSGTPDTIKARLVNLV